MAVSPEETEKILDTIAEVFDIGPRSHSGPQDLVDLLDKRGFVILRTESIAAPLLRVRESLRTLDSTERGILDGYDESGDLGVAYRDARARLIERARELASVLPEIEEPF